MPKPFITYYQQIALLKSKHLIISDEDAAKRVLAQIGYFSLIGGYKHPFKNKTTKMYRDGVTFEDIVMLYNFDESLRRLFLRYLLMIERSIKAQVAYVFCNAHGDSQAEYLNPHNYINVPAKQAGVNRLISTLSQLATRPTDYPYINHHQNVHHNVPLWVLINAVTFGSVSKMFMASMICLLLRLLSDICCPQILFLLSNRNLQRKSTASPRNVSPFRKTICFQQWVSRPTGRTFPDDTSYNYDRHVSAWRFFHVRRRKGGNLCRLSMI